MLGTIIIQVAICYFTIVLSRYAIYEHRHSIEKRSALFDVVHQVLGLPPHVSHITRVVGDRLQIGIVAVGIAAGLTRLDLLEGFVRAVTVGYSVRALFVVMTVLPPPTENCQFHRKLTVHGQCSDLFISGHQMINMAICLGLHRAGWLSSAAVIGIGLLSAALIVVGRNHYTIDVMAGTLLADACIRHLL